MTSKEIFRQYFKRKLVIWPSIGIAATLIRLLGGHETTFAFAATFLAFIIVAVVVVGYIDYNFNEKSAPKIIAGLLDKEPLSGFQNIGFTKEENNKLVGEINNYKIILSPLTSLENNNVLTVLIPLQIREGLDSYFLKNNDHFKFTLSGEIIFAETILKDYDNKYHYNKIFDLIDKTTNSLRENKIEPLNITDE